MRTSVQILLGLLVAIALLALLSWWVQQDEAQAEPPQTPPEKPVWPDDIGAAGRGVLERLEGQARAFHVAPRRDHLPGDCAPILRIAAGGAVSIPAAAPLPRQPGVTAWQKLGILVPRPRLADLSPSERASLVAIWSRYAPETLGPDAIRLHGCVAHEEEIRRLLSWLR